MKKLILILATLMLVSLSACEHSPQVPRPTDADFDEFAFPYEFEATDLFGNAVTQESLGEKRAFFVYHWATWCSPCVGSMPTLAELTSEYGEDVGFLALLSDFENNSANAVNIVQSANLPDNFIVISANAPSVQELLNDIKTGFVPTSAIITANNDYPESITGKIGSEHRKILNEITS